LKERFFAKDFRMPIVIERKSDGSKHSFADVTLQTKVGELKKKILAEFAPANPRGTRLLYAGKVLKSVRKLKHYKMSENDTIVMDDTKNWSSDSSSSGSETE
jgi:hypothetical protein